MSTTRNQQISHLRAAFERAGKIIIDAQVDCSQNGFGDLSQRTLRSLQAIHDTVKELEDELSK